MTGFGYNINGFGSGGGLPPYNADFLIVAGGGAGAVGALVGRAGGGGGAGGFRTFTCQELTAGANYAVTVGAGGAKGNPNAKGGDSSIIGSGICVVSEGGGRGGTAYENHPCYPTDVCMSGGSGGGGGGSNAAARVPTGGTGNTPPTSPSQGNGGGRGGAGDCSGGGGGGGGGANAAGSNGGNGSGGSGGAVGGSVQNALSTGSNIAYAQGGGGGNATSGGAGQDATANLGNGGYGGSDSGNQGGTGGSGFVVIRYDTAQVGAAGASGGNATATYCASCTAFKVHRFTSSGCYTA